MYCITSLSVAQTQYDPLGLHFSRRKRFPRLQGQKSSRLGSSREWRDFNVSSDGVHKVSTHSDDVLPPPGRRACLEVGLPSASHVHMCSFGVHRNCYRPRELGLCRGFTGTGSALFDKKWRVLGKLGSMRTGRACIYTRAFNPQSGGGGGGNGGPGKVILNLAGAGLLTYLTITGRLDWLFDAVLTIWLISTVLWWFAERSLIKGPCPNCGGEFQVFEFTLKEEYRLCPYCSQPFKLENRKFVRDGPQFSNQQTRGFKQQPFGGFEGFQNFGGPTSSRKREESSGVIVDVEAEVRDKD